MPINTVHRYVVSDLIESLDPLLLFLPVSPVFDAAVDPVGDAERENDAADGQQKDGQRLVSAVPVLCLLEHSSML